MLKFFFNIKKINTCWIWMYWFFKFYNYMKKKKKNDKNYKLEWNDYPSSMDIKASLIWVHSVEITDSASAATWSPIYMFYLYLYIYLLIRSYEDLFQDKHTKIRIMNIRDSWKTESPICTISCMTWALLREDSRAVRSLLFSIWDTMTLFTHCLRLLSSMEVKGAAPPLTPGMTCSRRIYIMLML